MYSRWLASALAGSVVASFLVVAAAAPASAGPKPFVLRDGVSQPVFSYADAVRESVWVELGVDRDGDGYGDRVAADIIRPSEPAARGQRVPVILEVSPYYHFPGRGLEGEVKTYLPDGTPVGFPLFYDNYFVPRGYAVVLVDRVATNRSTGCGDAGGLRVAAGRTVIDWLNGRATAYTSKYGHRRVSAGWANGDVGMIGKSADGTIANGVATTGVEGLRTIVPISAVSSYYDVVNSDGFNYGGQLNSGPPGVLNPRQERLCEPFREELNEALGTDGDWNIHWQRRDYTRRADRVRASVFAVHGLGDRRAVPPLHLGRWWEALSRYDVPRKLWLSQAGHVEPFDLRRAEWVDTLHRWFDHWLLGVDNGIMAEPMVTLERAPDQWVNEPTWPPAGTDDRTLSPRAGDVDSLGSLSIGRPGEGSATIVDHPELGQRDWARQPDQPSPARLLFTTAPLAEDVRLAGTGSITVTVRSSEPTATVSAALVDYGPATLRDYWGPGGGIRVLDSSSCWGASTEHDDACYADTAAQTVDVNHEVLSSGRADVGHWATLWHGMPLRPGRAYTMTFTLSTLDHVVPAGHRLGLVIAGTDATFYFGPPRVRPTLTFDLSGTSVSLPVASGSLG